MLDPLTAPLRHPTGRTFRRWACHASAQLHAWLHVAFWLRIRSIDPPHRVFVSHRRPAGGRGATAVSPFASQLRDILARAFGPHKVFFDLDTLHAGADLHTNIRTAVERAWCVIVVIEPGWERAQVDGTRGIDQPGDWCHQEVARALAVRQYPILANVFVDRPAFPVVVPIVVDRDRPTFPADGPLAALNAQDVLFLEAQSTDPSWQVEVLATVATVMEDGQTSRWDLVLFAIFLTIAFLALAGIWQVGTCILG